MTDRTQQSGTGKLPELLRLENGDSVNTTEDWKRRRTELLRLYSEYVYGCMPEKEKETLNWNLREDPETGGTLMTITVSSEGRSASFSVLAGLPAREAPEGGFPFFIEYWPWHYQNWFTKEWVTGFSDNCKYAMERGYACFQYDCGQVSADNETRTGAFFTLYPYEKDNPTEQRGALLAWAWGVAGAYDERIRVTVPSCSGAGGTAVFRTDNHGKTYDLTSLGGPVQWTNESVNEPFSNLQGGEGYWFCGNFTRLASAEALPVDQHMLCALAAGRERHLILVTGIVSEGWNNTEGQCLAYAASQPVWDLLDCGEQNNMIIHLDGHAILHTDMEMILDYCDVCLTGKQRADFRMLQDKMRGNLFLQDNRDRLDPLFGPYLR